jgi:Raf kinase inhibitor-like YbhB/YbcL family protein
MVMTYSSGWGYYPSGGLGVVLVILIVLLLMGRSAPLRFVLAAGTVVGMVSPMSALSAQAGGGSLTVSSPAFKDGQRIPEEYTDYGTGKSIPLSWSNLPPRARSIAIVMDDPDARTPRPFVHWVIYNIPAATTSLEAGLPTKPRLDAPKGALQGSNSKSSTGYFGPRPPKGDAPHHYHIKVYALDQELQIEPGADEERLLKATSGHVLGQGELTGTVQKK